MPTTLIEAVARSEADYRISNSDPTFPPASTSKNTYNYKFNPTGAAGAKVATKVFARTYTLAGGASQSIDFAGSLTDPFGEAVTFSKIKRIRIHHVDTGTSSGVLVNGAASNSCTNLTATLRRGGYVDLVDPTAAGYAVTAGTGDLCVITNQDGSNAATVQVLIYGE